MLKQLSFKRNIQKTITICHYIHQYPLLSTCNLSSDAYKNNLSSNIILDGFFNSVQTYPYRFAMLYNGDAITYRDLYYRVLQCADYLRTKYEINESDVVACSTTNRPEFFQLILACHLLKCTFVPLNASVNPNANMDVIESCNAKLLIYEHPLPINMDNVRCKNIFYHLLTDEFNEECSWIGHGDASLNDLEDSCSDLLNFRDYNLSNICQFMSTSGTTGTPKIITHSFFNKCIASKQYLPLFKYYQNENIFDPSEYASGCRILLTGSTFHVTTYNLLTCSASHGHCAVIPNKKEKSIVSELWKCIQINKVNAACFLSSSIYSMIAYNRSIDANHFKCAFITGEIMPSELIKKFMKMNANGINNQNENDLMRIINFYGSTESQVIGFSDPISINHFDDEQLYEKIMRIRPIPDIELRVNEDKELMVSTPCLMKEYYQNPEQTEAVISSDESDKRWYLIGEQVEFYEDDSFVINARNKDIFITDGSVCYPQSVENVILKHELVNGAIVIGLPYSDIYIDDHLPGLDEPIAFVTIDRTHNECIDDDGVIIVDILMLCEDHLDKDLGEIPFKIFIVEDIPKTANGKIKRDALKEIAVEYFKDQKLSYAKTKAYE